MDDIYDCMLISFPLIISSILFSAFIYYCPLSIFEDNFFILQKPSTSKTTQPSPSIPTINKTIQPIPPKPSTSKKIVITLPNIKEENNLVIIYKLPFNNNICIKKCMCIQKLLSEYKELNFDCSDDCGCIFLDIGVLYGIGRVVLDGIGRVVLDGIVGIVLDEIVLDGIG